MAMTEEGVSDKRLMQQLPLAADGDTDQIRRLRAQGRILTVVENGRMGETIYRGPKA